MDVELILGGLGAASIRAAWVTLPLVAVVSLVTWLGRRRLPLGLRYGLWSIVLLRFLLPVSVASSWSVMGLLDRHAVPESVVTVGAPLASEHDGAWRAGPDVGVRTADIQHLSVTGWSRGMIFGVIWWSGVGVMLGWAGITSWRCARWVAQGQPVTDPAWLECVAAGQAAFGLRSPIAIRAVPELSSPAVTGWFRPLLLLPTSLIELTGAERQHVVWHELAHVARNDLILNGLSLLVRVFQWWNPLAWWTQRCWLAERECACDALALERLPRGSAADYGRTLLKFLEQPGPRWVPAASLLGARSAMRQRLADVQLWRGPQSRWARRTIGAVVLLCAGICLTDAANPPEVKHPPIQVPANAVWRIAAPEASESGPTTARVYDLAGAVARARRDDPQLTQEMAAVGVHQLVAHVLGRPFTDLPGERMGQQLTLTLTDPQHRSVQIALDRWQRVGQRQISIEVRLIAYQGELTALGLPAGGEILSAAPLENELQRTRPESRMDVRAVRGERLPIPTYIQALAEPDVQRLLQAVQGDRKANMMAAPKVTVFEGTSAMIAAGTERPFVTGLETLPDGQIKPQVALCHDGFNLRLDALYTDDGVTCQLGCRVRQTELREVETMTIRSGDQDRTIQIPRIDDALVTVDAKLAAGRTLLIIPLRRDSQGQQSMTLITPRLLPPQP